MPRYELSVEALRHRALGSGLGPTRGPRPSAVRQSVYERGSVDDLWSFDGSSWVALSRPGGPLSGIRIAADRQHYIYSLGGFSSDSGLGVLRVLDNGRWQHVNVFGGRRDGSESTDSATRGNGMA